MNDMKTPWNHRGGGAQEYFVEIIYDLKVDGLKIVQNLEIGKSDYCLTFQYSATCCIADYPRGCLIT